MPGLPEAEKISPPRGAARAPAPPARVEVILTGAATAFSKHGFAATSMRQIARATDTSIGAIYYHFNSKESILHAIISTSFRRVLEALDERLEGIDDPGAALEAFVANHIEFFSRHLDEMRVMAHELDTLRGDAGDDIAALRRAYTERARKILSELRPDVEPDEVRLSVLCLFGMLNWTYRWFHTIPPTMKPDQLAAHMCTLFVAGYLRSDAGEYTGT